MRGSPEPGADLISRGQLFAVHIWQRAAAVPPPPARPALLSKNAGSASRIWSAFLGAAGAPSGAWPGLGGGVAPPGFPGSSLLWQRAAAPGQPRGWATGPERAAGLGFLFVGLGDLRD